MDHVPAVAVFAFGGMCGATFVGAYALWIARRMTHYVVTTSAVAMDAAAELARIRGFAQGQHDEIARDHREPDQRDWNALLQTIRGEPARTRAELH